MGFGVGVGVRGGVGVRVRIRVRVRVRVRVRIRVWSAWLTASEGEAPGRRVREGHDRERTYVSRRQHTY